MVTVADRYRLESPLGPSTWLGVDLETSLPVVVRSQATATPGGWLRLVHEAEALRELGRLSYFDRDYVVRPWVEGPTLAARLQAGPLDLPEALAVARALLTELAAVHARGVLHGDVKPANVVASSLIDFGMAAGGSPLYMAPELAGTLREPVGPWTDLYAFGVCLFEMLKGRPPFAASDLSQLLRMHLSAPRPTVGEVSLDAVLQRLLAPSPSERYQTAAAVAHDLERRPLVAGLTDLRSTLAGPGFVGREPEMARLLAASQTSERRLILVEAPAGGGKTRLLQELRARLGDRWSLWGQAATLASPEPLALFAGLVREAATRPARLAAIGPLGGVLAQAFPELRGLFASVDPGGEGHSRGAAALAELLEVLGDTVILLDDVQWADPVSLEALVRWARVTAPGALVVAACRTGELPRELGEHERVQVPALSGPELRDLWRSMVGGGGPGDLSRLEDLCEGNPFLAVEGLRGLQATGELTSMRGAALLQPRLDALEPEEGRVLALAAQVGRRFSLDLLVALAGEREAARALGAARDARLLWLGEQEGEFAHDRIREALLLELAPVERREVHRRIADWFAGRGDRRGQAYHWHVAGDARAPELALEVARTARAGFALGEARQFYAIAVGLESGLELQLERAEVDAALGFHAEARDAYQRIREAAPDRWLRARTLFRLGELEHRQNRMAEAEQPLQEALTCLDLPQVRWRPHEVLRLLRDLALPRPWPASVGDERIRLGLCIYKRLSDALGHGGDMLGFLCANIVGADLARQYPHGPEAGVLLADVGATLHHFNFFAAARRYCAQARAAAAEQPGSELAQVLSRSSIMHLRDANPAQALAYARRSREMFESLADVWELNMARLIIAWFLLPQGELGEVRGLARGMLTSSEAAGVNQNHWPAKAMLALCGDFENWPEGGFLGPMTECYRGVALGLRELSRGRPEEALEYLRAEVRTHLVLDIDFACLEAWKATVARICAERCPPLAGRARREYYREARRAAREAVRAARAMPCYLPHALREAALLARARGHELRARKLFAESLHTARHYPLEAERTRKAQQGLSAAEVYSLGPTSSPEVSSAPLERLVEHSERILTSPSSEELERRLREAEAELTSPEMTAHLAGMARAAEENLRREEERQVASRRLETSRARLRAVLESAGAALALVDGSRVLACNELFERVAPLAPALIERFMGARADLLEQGPWLEGRRALWSGRWTAAGGVLTVTELRTQGEERLSRFQAGELRAVAARLEGAFGKLAGHPQLAADLADTCYELRGVPDPSVDLAARVRAVARGVPLVLSLAPELPLSQFSRFALERIVCEAVHNAVRHAEPHRIEVSLWQEGRTVLARIADDGRGVGEGTSSGRGLKGMRWRAELAGGRLAVRAGEPGTILELWLPATE